MSASSSNLNQYDLAFKDFPRKEFFRLFIDKNRQHEGEDIFDKDEPGYKQAMLNAFDYMKKTLGKPLDAKEFEIIHEICIKNVRNIDGDNQFHPNCYLFVKKDVSPAALKENEEEKIIYSVEKQFNENLPPHERLALYDSYLADEGFEPQGELLVRSTLQGKDLNEITIIANNLFNEYYSKIKQAKTDDQKLDCIVFLCKKLEVSHFFFDGNQRTIVFVILNKLLIENNFSPVILEKPDMFDGYLDRQELIEAVKVGMKNFQAFIPKNAEEKRAAIPQLFAAAPVGTPPPNPAPAPPASPHPKG